MGVLLFRGLVSGITFLLADRLGFSGGLKLQGF